MAVAKRFTCCLGARLRHEHAGGSGDGVVLRPRERVFGDEIAVGRRSKGATANDETTAAGDGDALAAGAVGTDALAAADGHVALEVGAV